MSVPALRAYVTSAVVASGLLDGVAIEEAAPREVSTSRMFLKLLVVVW